MLINCPISCPKPGQPCNLQTLLSGLISGGIDGRAVAGRAIEDRRRVDVKRVLLDVRVDLRRRGQAEGARCMFGRSERRLDFRSDDMKVQ